MNKIFKFILVSSSGFSLMSFAISNEAPSYNEVLTQQLKCNTQYFSNLPWDKKTPVFAKMQPSTYVVISKPTVTELPQKNSHKEKERAFKASAIRYSKFRCETSERLRPSSEKEGVVETLITISESKPGTGLFQITGGEPGDIQGSNPEVYSNFLYEGNGGDKWNGFFCVVLIEDFLNNPTAIDVNKLCEGKPASDREATKKTIEQTRKAWIAAGVGKKQ